MSPPGHGRRAGSGVRSARYAMLRRLQNPADETGQTFVEWLGAMAFVVVLVTLVIAAAPGIGDKIVDVIKSALDAVTP